MKEVINWILPKELNYFLCDVDGKSWWLPQLGDYLFRSSRWANTKVCMGSTLEELNPRENAPFRIIDVTGPLKFNG